MFREVPAIDMGPETMQESRKELDEPKLVFNRTERLLPTKQALSIDKDPPVRRADLIEATPDISEGPKTERPEERIVPRFTLSWLPT
jgi:hypothetical protein